MYRPIAFAPGEIYHVCHRGLNKQDIFQNDKERRRFLHLLMYCNWPDHKLSYSIAAKLKHHEKPWPTMTRTGKGFTDVLCYCLMNNHIHLLLKENREHGISQHMQRTFNGYSKYFNACHQRTGGLFTGRFRAAHIDGDEQFLQVTRYIHLNPYTAHITNDPTTYYWSSIKEYIEKENKPGLCHTKLLQNMLGAEEYRIFVCDYQEYARELADIEHLALE